jgi:hypothetical protein
MTLSANGDPQLNRGGFKFLGSSITSITVRYQADVTGSLVLYWANENGGYSGARVITATPAYTANSGYQVATFNLATHPEWVGKRINSMRLDPLAGAAKFTEIDYIRGNGANAALALPGQNLSTAPSITADGTLNPSIASLQKMSTSSTRFGLTIDAQVGVTYRLMASPNLAPGSWREVNRHTAARTERIEIQDDSSATQQFYRIEFEQTNAN